MDDKHTPQKPNPSSSPRPNTYQISGVPVEFPYKPYGSQLAFMSRVISTLDRARRQGHCNALLESPTGTGKTLSLLCSALAWQQHRRLRPLAETPSTTSPPLQAADDPLLHGGGFIPEPDLYGNSEKAPQATKTKDKKKRVIPTIYYASRTHSQISQVIREYRKTSYRVPMAVLASRKHYCTNKNVCGKENVDEVCKLLLKDSAGGCLEFKNANKVKAHPSLQIGECLEVHDIEDLVRIGRRVKGCSYFAAQILAAESQLVFCPYSYIINPIVRKAMDVDIKGCIVILDEAHNIEDMARDGGSVDIEEEMLHALQAELGNLCMRNNLEMIYRPLYDVIQGIISWISIRKDNLQKCEFEHYLSYWTGEKAKQELQKAGISQQYFPVLQECATKAIKAAVDAAPGETHLSGISIIALEGLFSSLSYFFSGNGCHAIDYQLALQRYVKRDESNAASGWTIFVSLWCLNPAVVFREIADLSLSVILTSGTLSPLGSFSSELGVQFDTCMEAPHVINTETQLWATVLSSGVDNIQLNSSYKTADSYAFQDSLGATLEEICKIVPGGALVFFPSYKLLEKLHARWCQTGQWFKLSAQKEVFIEPRGSTDEFEPVLRGYYDTISGKSKPVPGKIRSGLKRILKHSGSKDSPQIPDKGAAFLAVCRGKVSEGIDFSDDNARVVVIVGIPFPNKSDIQVILKKKYNDTYKSSKNLLSGSEWYCHQAFRALNQAAGRCIRHRFDYGAIILLDERYKEQRNIAYVSKWLRNSIKYHKNFDDSLEGLQIFFQNTKEKLVLNDNSSSNDLPDSNSSREKLQNFESSNCVTTPMENQKTKISTHQIGKMDPDKKAVDKISQFTKTSTCIFNDSSPIFQPQTPLMKTKAGNKSFLLSCVADDSYNKYLKHFSSQSFSPGSSRDLPMDGDDVKDDVNIVAVTPEKLASAVPSVTKQDSPYIMSVNSYTHKKRGLKEILSNGSPQTDCSNLSVESTAQFSFCSSTNMSKSIDQRCPHLFVDNEKAELELVKLDNRNMLPLSTDPCREMELQVCCLSCKNPLGLPENNFLVKSLMMLTSKVYLSYTRTYGALGSLSPGYLSKTSRTSIHVLSSDILFINQQFFKGHRYISQHGAWCEEDGCVFRTAFCPFCTESDTCLGVHVLATDASNVHLLNKVLLYADCLCIKDGPKTLNEGILCKGRNFLGKGSDLVENPKSSSEVLIEKPDYDTKQKPIAIEDKAENPWCLPVENENYVGKVVIEKPASCPKQKPGTVRKNADNEQTLPVDMENFAYNSQTKPIEIEKFAYCPHPKTSEFIRTAKSKLKLPRRE